MIDFISSPDFMTYVLIPLLILVARVLDVTLGTVRMIFISKGEKLFSALVGFFEITIWLLALTRIMDNLTNVYAYLAYAIGFSFGTYLGVLVEERIHLGKVIVRVTTSKDSKKIIKELRDKRYTFTCIGVDGPNGKVESLHIILDKKHMNTLLNYIVKFDKKAFYTVEEAKIVTEHRFAKIPSEKVSKMYRNK